MPNKSEHKLSVLHWFMVVDSVSLALLFGLRANSKCILGNSALARFLFSLRWQHLRHCLGLRSHYFPTKLMIVLGTF